MNLLLLVFKICGPWTEACVENQTYVENQHICKGKLWEKVTLSKNIRLY